MTPPNFMNSFRTGWKTVPGMGKLRFLHPGKTQKKIRATTNGYLMDAETKTAQYRIQCEFIYDQKRRV